MYVSKYIIFGIILNSSIICGQFSTKGIFTLGAITGNDVLKQWSKYQSSISYIPTISFKKDISTQSLLDFEWGYQLQRDFSGDSLYKTIESPYRIWTRYSNEKLEARLGLQKIIFGPTQILRPLSWFDSFDIKNPTNETNGVEALRLKWFSSNNNTLWSWLIKDDLDTISYGGRYEFLSPLGEVGLTIHSDPKNAYQIIGQTGIPINKAHSRVAIDYRYDGIIGFWNESTMIQSKNTQVTLATFGADYTLQILNGVLIMAETMYTSNKNTDQNKIKNYSAFMASLPIGMSHLAMYVSQLDWSEEKTYHYLRWSSTFDNYSLNWILSLNPKRNQYNVPENTLPKSIAGFGTNIQFMFIYHH